MVHGARTATLLPATGSAVVSEPSALLAHSRIYVIEAWTATAGYTTAAHDLQHVLWLVRKEAGIMWTMVLYEL